MADTLQRLSTLLGRDIRVIRRTNDTPPRVSVIDVAVAITGKDARKAAQDVVFVKERYPDVAASIGLARFADARGRKGQKDTPVAHTRGCVEIVMLLPGKGAARIRRQAAELLCR